MKRALLALVAVFAGAVVGFGPTTAPAGAAPCAAGTLHVAMVIDFGDGVTVTSTCVTVPSGANAADALVARAQMLGTQAPEFQNGLLCAIDGYPDLTTTPCAAQNPDGTYAYWSYWHGRGGAWTYSSVGATFRVQADIVEGWRYFSHGQDTPSLAPPQGSAVATDTCPPPAPSTIVSDPGPASTAPPDTPLGGEGQPSTTVAGSSSATTTTSSISTSSESSAASSSSSRSSPASGAAAKPVVTIAASHRSQSGGSVFGVLVAVALAGALGAAGVVVVRRRAAAGR